jgi:D-alanyl-D-alanine carboxypeptidase (penicillin-binding protein 5/6)
MNRGTLLVSVMLLGWLVTPAGARAADPLPPPPPVAARAYLLLDFHSGQVLAEREADLRVEPASLTKIMTAYIAAAALEAGRIRLTDPVLVSEKAWRTGGSRMFIEVGKRVLVEDLLKGIVVQSGNDATVALAEHVGGSEEGFAVEMNRQAERLGLKNTHFTNASGLPDPEHYTSARDLATLSAALIREFPGEYALHSLREFTFNNIVQRNRNRLLWEEPGVDGIKTGHTEAAGYCLVASAMRDDMRLIAVILGAASEKVRTAEARKLLGYGFQFYQGRRMQAAKTPLLRVPVWKGEGDEIEVGVSEDLYATVPRGLAERLSLSVEPESPIIAPLTAGQPVGRVRVLLAGVPLVERPLVALQPMPEGGFFRRWLHALLLWFQ